MRKRQKMQIAGKLIERHRLAEQKQLFFAPGDRHAEIAQQGTLFYGSFDQAFLMAVLNAFLWVCRSKAFSICKKVDGFQKIGFALAI
jgi:hypothetical protein